MPFVIRSFTIIFLSVITMSSCITSRRLNYLQDPGMTIAEYKDTVNFVDYRLHIGDKLNINVISTDQETNQLFSGRTLQNIFIMKMDAYSDLFTYTILSDGSIDFPMVGSINIAGKTIREATEIIEVAIRPLFKFSTVEVRMLNRVFSVIGGESSGFYQIVKEKINIFEALALAGDIDDFGDRSKVRIIRETLTGTEVKTFDLRSKDILHSEFFYVQPNDVIYVQTLNEQFFSIVSLPSLISTGISTISFGAFIYNLFVPTTAN